MVRGSLIGSIAVALIAALGCGAPRTAAVVPAPGPAAVPEPTVSAEYSSLTVVGLQYTPADTIIAGLPVRAIDTTWVAASPLRVAMMPPEAARDPDDAVRDSDFGIGGDFNHDGIPDSALVGVFRTRRGVLGNFLLILTRANRGWRVADLETDTTGGARYSSVSVSYDSVGISWWYCRRCDFGVDLVWKDGRYQAREEAKDSL